MKRIIKRVGISAIATVTVLTIVALIFLRIALPPAPNLVDMIKKFERNQSSIVKVISIFQAIPFNTIGIDNTDDDYQYISIYEALPVERYAHNDDELHKAFKCLFDDGCMLIKKEENCIYFQWWAMRDASISIVYSLDGGQPKMRSYFPPEAKEESFIPLGYENWYYYSFRFKG